MSDTTAHQLTDAWPGFLDCLETDPDRAWKEFHEFTWRALRAVPPPVFRDLDPAVQEDLIADIVVRCAENEFRLLRGYRNQGIPFAGWLGRIVRNRALDWIRREGNRPEFQTGSPQDHDIPGLIDQKNLMATVSDCLGRIRGRCRLLLVAAADGLKPREIAVVLGLPEDSGKKISDDLRYCRRTLRQLLEESGLALDTVIAGEG